MLAGNVAEAAPAPSALAALVREVKPVAAILARIEAEAEAALRRAMPR